MNAILQLKGYLFVTPIVNWLVKMLRVNAITRIVRQDVFVLMITSEIMSQTHVLIQIIVQVSQH